MPITGVTAKGQPLMKDPCCTSNPNRQQSQPPYLCARRTSTTRNPWQLESERYSSSKYG
jgi:hypothetical protein